MAVVTMRQMLESGVHFGHQTRRWNPKMKRFILTERNGIYIIDLTQSLTSIDRAYSYVKETVSRGGTVMFVGTKKQAQEAVAEQASRVGMPYVNERWLGGMLTNFQTVYKRLQRLKELEQIDFDDVAGSVIITADSGSGAVLGPFEGRTQGIGPVVSYVSPPICGHTILAEVKWLHELDVNRRLSGDYVWFKAVLAF